MTNELENLGLSWKRVICFCSDNANVMRSKGGVASFIAKQNYQVFMNGCTCHLAAIAAKTASKALKTDSCMSVEDLLIDIMCHLKGSSKRSRELQELQEACGLTLNRLIAYCPSRWLSLGKCVPRLVEIMPALLAMFATAAGKAEAKPQKRKAVETEAVKDDLHAKKSKQSKQSSDKSSKSSSHGHKSESSTKTSQHNSSHDDRHRLSIKSSHSGSQTSSSQAKTPPSKKRFTAAGREKRIFQALENPRTKLHCLFLKSNLKLFDAYNLYFQKDEPVIHEMRKMCIELLIDLIVRFVKSSEVKRAATTDKGIFGINFDDKEIQKPDDSLAIGVETKEFLQVFSEDEKNEFFLNVRSYFAEACKYIVKKFPLNTPFLQHAEVADIERRGQVMFDSVVYFCSKYKQVFSGDMDELEQEFLRYQLDDMRDMKMKDTETQKWDSMRIDEKWGRLESKYPSLSIIMQTILSVPHSNADSERVFSATRRIDTAYRSSMDISLLEALIIVKRHMITRQECCFSPSFSKEFLKRAKSCTYQNKIKDKDVEKVQVDPMDDVTGDVLRLLDGLEPRVTSDEFKV